MFSTQDAVKNLIESFEINRIPGVATIIPTQKNKIQNRFPKIDRIGLGEGKEEEKKKERRRRQAHHF